MTLIETLLYAVLLSFLLSGVISFAYAIHVQDFDLLNSIHDRYE